MGSPELQKVYGPRELIEAILLHLIRPFGPSERACQLFALGPSNGGEEGLRGARWRHRNPRLPTFFFFYVLPTSGLL